jgi:gluconate kinase
MDLGIPLTDDDRWIWLKNLASEINRHKNLKGCCVACSALKKSYLYKELRMRSKA